MMRVLCCCPILYFQASQTFKMKAPFIVLLAFLLFLEFEGFSQESQEELVSAESSIPNALHEKLAGVQYVVIEQSKETLEAITHSSLAAKDIKILGSLKDYFENKLNFEAVAFTADQIKDIKKAAKSLCEIAYANYFEGSFLSDLGAMGTMRGAYIEFWFCDKSHYKVLLPDYEVSGMTNVFTKTQYVLSARGFKRVGYNAVHSSSIVHNKILFNSEAQLIDTLKSRSTNKYYEGVFENFLPTADEANVRIGIIQHQDTVYLVYLGGAVNEKDWTVGEVKGYLHPTKSKFDCLVTWFDAEKVPKKNSALSFTDENSFTFLIGEKSAKFVRVY